MVGAADGADGVIALGWAGTVATLTIDRGRAANAFDAPGWAALSAAVAAVGHAHAVVLRSGDARVFSAGADLDELATLHRDTEARAPFRERMRGAIDALAALPMPVIAAVDGACHGAAVAIVLAADIVVVGDGASFCLPPARIGIAYPAADVAALIARVGRGGASRLLLTAERVDADAAVGMGLADLRVADAGVAAAALASRIAAFPADGVAVLKRIVRDPQAAGQDAAFDARFGSAAFGAAMSGRNKTLEAGRSV